MLNGDLCKRSAPRAEVGRRALDTRPGARADRTTARAACRTDDSGSGEAFIISALAYTAKAPHNGNSRLAKPSAAFVF
jgi:hypothetical protein